MANKKSINKRPAKKSVRPAKKSVRPGPTKKPKPKTTNKKPLKNVKPKTPKKTNAKDSRKGQLARTRKPVSKTNTKGTGKIKRVSGPKKPIQQKQKPQSIGRTAKANVAARAKSTTDKRTVNTSILKGKNILAIKAGGKPENVAKKLQGLTDGKQFKYLLNKNKPVKGKPAKEPKAVVLIYTVTTDEGVKKTFSKLSPNDFIVNAENVQQFIESSTANIADEFDELYGGTGETENTKVNSVSVKFIY